MQTDPLVAGRSHAHVKFQPTVCDSQMNVPFCGGGCVVQLRAAGRQHRRRRRRAVSVGCGCGWPGMVCGVWVVGMPVPPLGPEQITWFTASSDCAEPPIEEAERRRRANIARVAAGLACAPRGGGWAARECAVWRVGRRPVANCDASVRAHSGRWASGGWVLMHERWPGARCVRSHRLLTYTPVPVETASGNGVVADAAAIRPVTGWRAAQAPITVVVAATPRSQQAIVPGAVRVSGRVLAVAVFIVARIALVVRVAVLVMVIFTVVSLHLSPWASAGQGSRALCCSTAAAHAAAVEPPFCRACCLRLPFSCFK